MNGRRILLIIICSACVAQRVAAADVLLLGNCVLRQDPLASEPSFLNMCLSGDAGTWILQKSKAESSIQPPVMHRADGKISVLLTPWLGLHAWGHSAVFVDRQTQKTINKETETDSLNIQLGNNALSRHRLNVGYGRPTFRLNHNQRTNLEFAWGLDKFLAPFSKYGTYTYDNQLESAIQITYGRLVDKDLRSDQQAFGSARLIYDLAALEGTRVNLGGYGDGLVRRAVSLGLLNINGKGDETSLELTRTFSFNPYKPAEFKQLIRLSYISHMQGNMRYKFQYDDVFRHIRLGSLAALYEPIKFTQAEFLVGYAKQEDVAKKSHWFVGLNVGAHLE